VTALEPLNPPAKRIARTDPASDFLASCILETLTGLFGEPAARILFSRCYSSECVSDPERFIEAIKVVVGDSGAEIISKLVSRRCAEKLASKQAPEGTPMLDRWRHLVR